jgi:shikimate kinase
VVAAAGGSVLSADNRSLMDQHARCVVWLDADPATLAKRTMKGGHRPLLDTNPTEQLTAMDAQRRAIYESLADVRVDTAHKPIDAVVEEILSALQGAHAS